MILGGVLIGMTASAWVASVGQVSSDTASRPQASAVVVPAASDLTPAGTAKSDETLKAATDPPSSTIEHAMGQAYRLPFGKPTSLEVVRAHLMKTLNAPVVLDLAALERQGLTAEDTVQLELDRVRLKTSLQLLLDQVGLTYRIVASDNLLVITDKEGSDDPLAKIWAEIRELHRDIHELQDSVDDLTDLLAPEGGDFRMHRPTIIEEIPGPREPGEKTEPEEGGRRPGKSADGSPGSNSRPGARTGPQVKPGPSDSQSPPAGESPARTHLGRPRKRV